MAGRMRRSKHRGGPPRLGKPSPGTMRRLTIGEANALDGKQRWFVYVDAEGAPVVFRPAEKTYGSQTVYVCAELDSIALLEAYWKREG